jgi:formylglycine-generating enzyme required for sulfatase activity
MTLGGDAVRWEQGPGLCPACERETPVGAPCATPVCRRRGLHGLPRELAQRYVASPRAAQDPMVGQLVGDSLVVGALGEGGCGVVYSVLQRPLFRLAAALKLTRVRDDSPERSRRMASYFEDEASALAVLQHPNIVRLLQFGFHEGSPYLVIELVPGGRSLGSDLEDRQDAATPAGRARARRILHQVLDALEAAHAAGIVHRDIKPENVLLQSVPGNPDLVRVVDFGLAKFLESGSNTSVAVGTPVYMAPEQLTKRGLGPWTDLYAVGVLAFRMLTGREAFADETTEQVILRKLDVRRDPVARLDGLALPPGVLAFFRKAMAVRPEERYRSVEEFRAALDAAFGELAVADAAVRPASAAGGPGETTDLGARVAASGPPVAARPGREAADTAPADLAGAGALRAAARRAGAAALVHRVFAALVVHRRVLLLAAGGLAAAALATALLLPGPTGSVPPPRAPGPAAASPPVPGAIIVKTDPPGAAVRVPGVARPLGQTPLRLTEQDLAALPPGRAVRLEAPGRWPVDHVLPPLAPGVVRETAVALLPPPVVPVRSDPPGAEVILEGEPLPLGLTPFDWTVPVTLADRPSELALVARQTGHMDARVVVTVAALRRGEPVELVLRPYNPAGIEWVPLPGGAVRMGANEERALDSELPVHEVVVAPFELARTEVTFGQYRRCVEARVCTPPGEGAYCGWGDPKRDDHPVNCVDREQARTFAAWAGGRLPSEAEWEYAARGAADDRHFPWGDLMASCRRAVLHEGCDRRRATWPVCSKPLGASPQGLCDLAGNIAEWVEDCWHPGYTGAPADGSAWTTDCHGPDGVVRGGSWVDAGLDLRTFSRRTVPPDERRFSAGLRVAR